MTMRRANPQLQLLVVEDDADQRDLIRETLEEHFGMDTTTGVGSLQEALKAPLELFDLILSDYNLPDGSGMELLAAVTKRCATPVILVTGENVGKTAIEAIRKGATDYVVKFGDYLNTIPLVVEKNLTVAQIMRDNLELQKQLQEKNILLEQMASTDPLTGLYNRRHFGLVLEQLFAEAERYEKDLACVMIDMDGFKQLNDARGHQFGDQLLQLAGRVIKNNLRKMDIAARYGGDEFVMLIPQAGIGEAANAAERIRAEFKQTSVTLLGGTLGVSMSVGIASMRDSGVTVADQLVASADEALYAAKGAGRDRVSAAPRKPVSRRTA